MKYEAHPLYLDAKKRMSLEFERKRDDGTLSKAHDESHVLAVSTYGGATARALANGQGYSDVADRWGLLTAVGGLLHDYERYKNETIPHGPESAKYSKKIRNEGPYCDLSEEEFNAIYLAIYHHSEPLEKIREIFGEPIGAEATILPSVVAHGISVGDDVIDGSGFPVLKRRAFFVGKERMTGGDITMFTYPGGSHLAVLGETMIRLYKKNPLENYPQWLKPFAEEWHAIQYQFYRGLLDFVNMSEEDASKYMLDKNFPKFDEALHEKIKSEKHLSGKHFAEEEYPVLSRKIEAFNNLQKEDLADLGESSYQLVKLFSTSESPEQAIALYETSMRSEDLPRHLVEFMDGIINYNKADEHFVKKFEHNLTLAVRKVASEAQTNKGAI